MDFPVFYQDSSKIVPHDPGHIVSAGFHITPQGSQSIVQTTYIDKTFDEQNFDDIYNNTGKNIIIRLLKAQGRFGFQQLREVKLEKVKKCQIKFSESGKYFCILLQ